MKTQFTEKQNRILSEIYRRLNYFHSGNLSEPLLYLGLPNETREMITLGILKPYSKETPRVLNWYNLTQKGKNFFSNYQTKQKLSNSINSRLFNREFIKRFNKSLLD